MKWSHQHPKRASSKKSGTNFPYPLLYNAFIIHTASHDDDPAGKQEIRVLLLHSVVSSTGWWEEMARGRKGTSFATSSGGAKVFEAPGAYSSAQITKVRCGRVLDEERTCLVSCPPDEKHNTKYNQKNQKNYSIVLSFWL